MEIRPIESGDARDQFVQWMDYCFKDETGWTQRMFPLPSEDRAVGLFDGDRLTAALLSKGFTSRIFGETVPSNGIACVVTAPQYRNQRHIRKLLSQTLHEEYERGAMFSALYPFQFGFYQKFGYGSLGPTVGYMLDPHAIRTPELPPGQMVPFNASARQLDELFEVYNHWVLNFDFGILRPKPTVEKFVQSLSFDKENVFLYYDENEVCQGFIQFYFNTQREYVVRLKVTSMAWNNAPAFQALLHFLWTHRDQCKDIKWTPPPALPLSWLTREPRIEQYTAFSWMARPLNVPELVRLKAEKLAETGRTTFSITDDVIPSNSGTYTIQGAEVIKEPFRERNVLPFHLFSSLLFGGISLDQAQLAGLVTASLDDMDGSFFAFNRNIYLSEKF
ncbi:MAG: GNAT family N-acetyltransferase [Candidatus Zhuqueibacterota bacterium]